MAGAGSVIERKRLNKSEVEQRLKLLESGHAAFDKENYKKALEHYHLASVLDGSEPEVWWCLGLAYYNLGYSREAWRSYKLALHCDPESVEATWYAAEFLYNIEDYTLAKLLLERYLFLETDQDKILEARELLREVLEELGEEPLPLAVKKGAHADDEEEDEDEDDFEGFDVDDDEVDEDEDFEDEEEELDVEAEEDFIPGLELRLTGMEGKCGKCSVALPLDAPYCYSCQAPQFYKDR